MGIDICFEELDNPVICSKMVFKSKKLKLMLNDWVVTSNKANQPVWMVQKGLSEKGFALPNFNSKKGEAK